MGVRHPRSEDQGGMMVAPTLAAAERHTDAGDDVAALLAKARVAQAIYETWTQERVDEAVAAAGWAVVAPEHNQALAERAVCDTGLGNVADKIAKNRRKTIGLLADLR